MTDRVKICGEYGVLGYTWLRQVLKADVPHMLAYLHHITGHGGRDTMMRQCIQIEKAYWKGNMTSHFSSSIDTDTTHRNQTQLSWTFRGM